MKNKEMIVPCPNCQKSVSWTNKNDFKPFCSKRCKLIDLGEWASESHRIAGRKLDPDTVEQLTKK